MNDRARRQATALAAALVFHAPAASAQVAGGPGPAKPARPPADAGSEGLHFASTATLAGDYVNRGVSQTGGTPEEEAGVEGGFRGLYAGVTTFHIDFRREQNRTTDAEVDVYGGYETQLGGQAFDIGVIRYLYTPQPAHISGLDYTEVYGKTARSFGPATLAGSVYYSSDGASASGETWYGVLSGAWAVNKTCTVSGLVGRQTVQKGGGYNDWNAGATYALAKHLNLDLRYWNTSRHDLGRDYGERLVGSLQFSF